MTHRVLKLIFISCVLLCLSCREKPVVDEQQVSTAGKIAMPDWKLHQLSGFKVLKEFPHNRDAFTQGLILLNGDWIESTGGYGTSSLLRVEKETGKVLKKKELSEDFFGEGVVELDGKIYQLTWENEQGFVYDSKTLERLRSFSYKGEGWGLTTDGKTLIMSNGSDRLQYLDPKTFRVIKEVSVRLNGRPVDMLNELEYVEGEIFANVWHAEQILRINPINGTIVGMIDLSGINAKEKRRDSEHVLNGIAYDSESKELFVTGKCWSKIYQIELVQKQ